MVSESDPRNLADGFIITENGLYLGIGTARDLIREITQMQINAARYANPLTLLPGNVPIRQALSRLLMVVENYPTLQSNQNFLALQSQLEGTENRITTARNRYIKAVQDYNILARQFPTNLTAMVFGYEQKPSFTVEDEKAIAAPPKGEFGKAAPASTAPAK